MPVSSYYNRAVIEPTKETIRQRFFVFSEGRGTCEALVMSLTAAGYEPHPSGQDNVFSLAYPAPTEDVKDPLA